MTPRETLQKYNLKTDVKSIRERVLFTDDFGEPSTALYRQQLWKLNGFHSSQIVSECHSADLSLLCELAEKGEKLSHEIQRYFELDRIKWGFTKMQLDEYSALICALSKEGDQK